MLNLDRDWTGAERGYKRAIELDPNSAEAHTAYGSYLAMVGLLQEGIEHQKRAVELDPLLPRRHVFLSSAYYFDRQFDLALEAARAAGELDPSSPNHLWVAWIYREKGMYEQAFAEFRKDNPVIRRLGLGHLGNTYARAGRVRKARDCLREIKRRWKEDHVGVYDVVLIYAGLGEKDHAFEWLERAYEEGDLGLLFLKIDPPLDLLRSDPRFQDLLRRMNFPS